MADISAISSGVYQAQLYGRLAKNTMSMKNAANAEQAVAQVIETASKSIENIQGDSGEKGIVDIYV
ncbi:MAG: hypothetical protein EPN22_03835 [Nitrospirae bacterium]|nr:MAG: hypothetical protein EPN22_03835 [Nitrospirota bacterium]